MVPTVAWLAEVRAAAALTISIPYISSRLLNRLNTISSLSVNCGPVLRDIKESPRLFAVMTLIGEEEFRSAKIARDAEPDTLSTVMCELAGSHVWLRLQSPIGVAGWLQARCSPAQP